MQYSHLTAVGLAVDRNNLSILRFLLAAAGADPNIDAGDEDESSSKDTPCYRACRYNNHDCVRVLLALGATPAHEKYGCRCPGDIAKTASEKEEECVVQ